MRPKRRDNRSRGGKQQQQQQQHGQQEGKISKQIETIDDNDKTETPVNTEATHSRKTVQPRNDRLPQKTSGGSGPRTIRPLPSNWDRYVDLDDGEKPENEEVETTVPTDFEEALRSAGDGVQGRFRLQDEKEWEERNNAELNAEILSVDCEDLAASLSCIPLYRVLSIGKDSFEPEDITRFEQLARVNYSTYKSGRTQIFNVSDSHEKAKVDATSRIEKAKVDANSRIEKAKVDANSRIEKAKVDANSRILSLLMDGCSNLPKEEFEDHKKTNSTDLEHPQLTLIDPNSRAKPNVLLATLEKSLNIDEPQDMAAHEQSLDGVKSQNVLLETLEQSLDDLLEQNVASGSEMPNRELPSPVAAASPEIKNIQITKEHLNSKALEDWLDDFLS